MEEILTQLLPIAKYGILGTLLMFSLGAIIFLYKKVDTIQKEFRNYISESNEKLFTVLDKSTDVFNKIVVSLDNNTTINKNFSDMLDKKLDLIELLKNTKS